MLGLMENSAPPTEDPEVRPRAMTFGRHSRSRERRVLLGRWAASILVQWAAVRGCRPGRLFIRLDRWGNPTGEDMSALGRRPLGVKRRSKRAGLEPVSVLDLRHTAIRDLVRAGVGGLTILPILGQTVDLSPYEDRPGEEDGGRDALPQVGRRPLLRGAPAGDEDSGALAPSPKSGFPSKFASHYVVCSISKAILTASPSRCHA